MEVCCLGLAMFRQEPSGLSQVKTHTKTSPVLLHIEPQTELSSCAPLQLMSVPFEPSARPCFRDIP